MKRALISVFDKSGIVDFATELKKLGWEIISTGGTSKKLKEAGINVTEIEEVTKFPECFDGRVKTIHPKIEGGILAVRNNEQHQKTMQELDVQPIDIVVCNLYPFKETLLKQGVTHDEIIENIDIGGPTMLRAAAKNYQFVTVIVNPADYQQVVTELKSEGTTSFQTRQMLAASVFRHTSHYDTLVSDYFDKKIGNNSPSNDVITFTFCKKQDLRYGENPHQAAAFYSSVTDTKGSLSMAEKIHGKELSFNNINDTNGALEALKEFEAPTVVGVKHANPCAIASANTIVEAYKKAYEADKISIYGGIVAANREIDSETATEINKIFIEVVIAPSFTKSALEILMSKKNIRVLQLPDIQFNDYQGFDIKKVLGGILVQQRNTALLTSDYKIVTEKSPTENELADLMFAWKAVKHTKSNGIVVAKNIATIGIGPGQVSRIWALQNAIRQATGNTNGAVLASDAFFPFSDNIEAAAAAGISAIIQPGGSVRDVDSIEAANKYGISMIFTNIRHFKH